MRILILHPPWPGPGYGGRSQNRWPRKRGDKSARYPLYLCYVGTLLKENGYDVHFLDAEMKDLSEKAAISKVKSLNPDVVYIESATPTINYDRHFVKELKKVLPDVKVIFAGYHVTYFPQDTLKDSSIDIVVKGEQDYVALDVLRALRDGKDLKTVYGISYRKGNKIYHNELAPLVEHLDELPFPDRDLIPHQDYLEGHVINKPFTFVISSRSCPRRCSFCLWPTAIFRKRFRIRRVKNTVDEIEWLIKKYGMKEIFLDDGTFNVTKKRVIDFCKELEHRNIKIVWGCSARVDKVDEEMLNWMKRTGCKIICYGLESSSPKTLERVNKDIDVSQMKQAIKLTKDAGIIAHANFMVGFPWETREDIENTIKFSLEVDPDTAQYSLVFPHPGSPMYEEAIKNEWFLPGVVGNWERFEMSQGPVLKCGVPSGELMNIISDAHKKFFLRPSYIAKRALKIRSVQDFKMLFKGGKSIIFGKILFGRGSD